MLTWYFGAALLFSPHCFCPGSSSCGLCLVSAQGGAPTVSSTGVAPPLSLCQGAALGLCGCPRCRFGLLLDWFALWSPLKAVHPLLLQIFDELDQAGFLLAKETLEDGLPMHDGKGDVRKCPYYAAKQDGGRSCLSKTLLQGGRVSVLH